MVIGSAVCVHIYGVDTEGSGRYFDFSVFNMFSPYGLASLNWTLLGDEFGADTGGFFWSKIF